MDSRKQQEEKNLRSSSLCKTFKSQKIDMSTVLKIYYQWANLENNISKLSVICLAHLNHITITFLMIIDLVYYMDLYKQKVAGQFT